VPRSSRISCGSAGVGDRPVHVGHLEGEVDDAVAVRRRVPARLGAGAHRPGEHEPGRPGRQHVLGVLGRAGLRPAVGGRRHAERRAVEVRCLPGVADDEPHVIQPEDGELFGRVGMDAVESAGEYGHLPLSTARTVLLDKLLANS
jgi:hypothetical protein